MLINVKNDNNQNLCINTDNIESFGVAQKPLPNGNFAFTVAFYGASKTYFCGEFSDAEKAAVAYDKVLSDLKTGSKICEPLLNDKEC